MPNGTWPKSGSGRKSKSSIIWKKIEVEVYRLKGHKQVVVRLEGLASVALWNYIAKACLSRL
ncbi:MAG: hypothetical protein LBQ74_10240 [Prevotella sp.]|nr:hypothetical protein [Prevotella sp.]